MTLGINIPLLSFISDHRRGGLNDIESNYYRITE